jgi:hypothetical protein
MPPWVGQRVGSNGKKEVHSPDDRYEGLHTQETHDIFILLSPSKPSHILTSSTFSSHRPIQSALLISHSPIVGLSWLHQVICVITKSCVGVDMKIWKTNSSFHARLTLFSMIFDVCCFWVWRSKVAYCDKSVVLNTFDFGKSWALMRPTRWTPWSSVISFQSC